MATKHLKFENVKGYATYANAQKAAEKQFGGYSEDFRWVVIALPSGRFAPLVIINDHTNPGHFISLNNVCLAN